MATIAAVASPKFLRAQLAKADGSFKTIALTGAAMLATFFGGIGLGTSMAIDRVKNGEIAKDKKKILADTYRNQIATQLGISPDRVGVSDLELAAKVNPQFAQLIHKVESEKTSNNRTSVVATGAGFALGGMLPGVSAVSSALGYGVAKTVGHVGGAIGGGMASGLLNKDVLFTQDIVEHMDAKAKQGQPIDAFDIMLLRISQNEALQADIKKKAGKPFHKMNETEQRAIIAAMPDLYNSAEGDAIALNAGRVTQQDLLVTSPGMQVAAAAATPAKSWTQRVGGPRQQNASFVQAYEAEQTTGATRVR